MKPLEEVDLWAGKGRVHLTPLKTLGTACSKMTPSMDLIFVFLLGYGLKYGEKNIAPVTECAKSVKSCLAELLWRRKSLQNRLPPQTLPIFEMITRFQTSLIFFSPYFMTQKSSQKKSEVDSFTPLRGVCPQNCYIISGTRQRANFMTPHPTPTMQEPRCLILNHL